VKLDAIPTSADKEGGGASVMIQLTRLNGHHLYLNCDLLKSAEALPDTVLTLSSGDKIVVLESCETVVRLATQFHADVLRTAWLPAVSAPFSAPPPQVPPLPPGKSTPPRHI
jgi:flagellar protein FlbD